MAYGCVSGPVAAGRRAADNGDYEVAARHFRRALRLDAGNAALWLELGRAEMAADRPGRAREACLHSAELRPHRARAWLCVGRSFELQRLYGEARVAYERSTEVAPQSARAHRVLGVRLLRWGFAEEATQPLARAVELDPEHAETWNALALSHYHAGDLAAAERTFRRGLARHRSHRPLHLGLAALLVNGRRWVAALAVYDHIVDAWPRFAAAHVGRALLLHELGRTDEALEAFVRAADVARDPRPYRARLRRYRLLLRGSERGD